MDGADTRTDANGHLAQLVAQNSQELGRYFKDTLAHLKSWREGRVLALICRLPAYRDNDVGKLLEFIQDLKQAHAARIRFHETYANVLFNFPDVVAAEMEETRFLDEVVTPLLKRLNR